MARGELLNANSALISRERRCSVSYHGTCSESTSASATTPAARPPPCARSCKPGYPLVTSLGSCSLISNDVARNHARTLKEAMSARVLKKASVPSTRSLQTATWRRSILPKLLWARLLTPSFIAASTRWGTCDPYCRPRAKSSDALLHIHCSKPTCFPSSGPCAKKLAAESLKKPRSLRSQSSLSASAGSARRFRQELAHNLGTLDSSTGAET